MLGWGCNCICARVGLVFSVYTPLKRVSKDDISCNPLRFSLYSQTACSNSQFKSYRVIYLLLLSAIIILKNKGQGLRLPLKYKN
jgi:hypothetical protein